jgi:DNA repair protein RecO (recombination protein O)
MRPQAPASLPLSKRMEKTEAILIDRRPWRETSLIVQWCAPEVGLFNTIAKGVLRPKSPFFGRLDLFVSAEVRFVRSRTGDLHTLAEVQWTDPRLGLRESYGRVLAATYFVKLIAQVAERETPIPVAHDLLHKALDYLATHDPTPALVLRFENRLAEELGIAAEGGQSGAASIQQAFHRRLPVQREQLFKRMGKNPKSEIRNPKEAEE